MRRHAERLAVDDCRLRRIVKQPHLHHRLGAELQKIIHRHAEAHCKYAQQSLSQLHCLSEIGLGSLPQPWTFRWPTIRTMEWQPGRDFGVAERQVDADFIAFLEIGRA